MVCKKLTKGKDVSQIATDLDEDESHIQEICNIAQKFAPDYDAEKIFEELSKSKELVKNTVE